MSEKDDEEDVNEDEKALDGRKGDEKEVEAQARRSKMEDKKEPRAEVKEKMMQLNEEEQWMLMVFLQQSLEKNRNVKQDVKKKEGRLKTESLEKARKEKCKKRSSS
jgi:hypothetical protein